MAIRKNSKKPADLLIDPGQTWLRGRIEEKLLHGENVIFTAPPGYGKSNMVKSIAFNVIETNKDYQVCFMDLLSITSKASFLSLLRKEVLQFTSPGEISQFPSENEEPKLLSLPEQVAKRKKIKLLLCINNIQNIARFQESEAFQMELRFMNRKREHCVYLLYGHNRELMKSMFQNPYKPMNSFGRLYTLKAPNLLRFKTNINEYFFNSGKRITPEALKLIYSLCNRHPFYAELLTTHAWWRTQFICTEQIIRESLEDLVNQFQRHYQVLLDQLTIKQVNYMRALLFQTQGFCSKENLHKYELGRSSNVSRIRKSLEEKEIIISFHGETFFIDPIMEYWLANYYFELPK